MKRVFLTAGLSFILSLFILNYLLPDKASVYLLASMLLLVFFLIFKPLRKKKEIVCVLISFVISTVSFICVTELSYKSAQALKNQKCEITAAVTDIPTISSGGNFSYPIKTESINGEKRKIRMRLYTAYNISAEPYDKIEFSSYPFVPGEDNDSMLGYFKGKGVYIAAYTKYDVKVYEPDKKPLVAFFSLRKAESEKNIRENFDGDYAEFAISILFGDKTYLSDEAKDSFRLAGLSHIMAVSGLHMSVWIMGLYLLMRKLGFDDKACGGVCIFACLCLICFSAFSVSVIRAAVMLTVYLSAPFFKRKSDSLNSLGFAAFLICIINPFAVCDVSFLLSFFATLGIIVFSDLFPFAFRESKNRNVFMQIFRYILTAAAVCISASVFTSPILIGYFSSLGPWAVLGNIAVSFAVAPCLLLSGILAVFGNIGFIAYPVKTLLLIAEKYIFGVVDFIAALPYSSILLESNYIRTAVSLGFTALIALVYISRKKKISSTSLAALSVLILISCIN